MPEKKCIAQAVASEPPAHLSGRRFRARRAVLRWLLAGLLLSQLSVYGEDARKPRSAPPPEYPEIAKKLNIRGIARVQATVTPEGNVKGVKELGGNPVLVEALARAVKAWKYEPADRTSVIEVKYDFQPQ